MSSKTLAELVPSGCTLEGDGSIEVSSIVLDSRKVQPGSIFAALKGEKTDGTQFIAQAISQGAVAVLVGADDKVMATNIAVIHANNPRLALAKIASVLYPGEPEYMVAVTGTDGKTSTADFFRQFMHLLKKPSASIGTLGVYGGDGEKLIEGTHTTPDAVSLHQILTQLQARNITHVCMEASSHGLHQYRMHGAHLTAAAFTNIARDHLDYHKTEDEYFTAKSMLFADLLPQGKTAVLNADDKHFSSLKTLCSSRLQDVIDFGRQAEKLRIASLTPHASGQTLECDLMGNPYTIEIPMVGGFQAMNILAAMGLAMACGESLDALLEAIPKLQAVPGRMEHVATLKNGAAIYVDYAHTPLALANILSTIRPHVTNQLHVVFGCGGDRDAGKRPEMGRIASELAEQVIVTDDNPRSEDPALIRAAIMAACPSGKEVADRREAIYAATRSLKPGDVLVIAGKGHEKVQIIAGVEHPFDDVMVARAAAGE